MVSLENLVFVMVAANAGLPGQYAKKIAGRGMGRLSLHAPARYNGSILAAPA
jgi:hypothetical protein